MKTSRSRRTKMRMRNRLGMSGIALVTVLLLGVFLWQGRALKAEIARYEEQEAALREQIEKETERTEEIEEIRRHMQTDAYAEEVARNRLGLVKENEIVFKEEE